MAHPEIIYWYLSHISAQCRAWKTGFQSLKPCQIKLLFYVPRGILHNIHHYFAAAVTLWLLLLLLQVLVELFHSYSRLDLSPKVNFWQVLQQVSKEKTDTIYLQHRNHASLIAHYFIRCLRWQQCFWWQRINCQWLAPLLCMLLIHETARTTSHWFQLLHFVWVWWNWYPCRPSRYV